MFACCTATSQQATSATLVTSELTNWSSSGQTAATDWSTGAQAATLYPANVQPQPIGGLCEAASVQTTQQTIYSQQRQCHVSSQEHNYDDKLIFEDGLGHLRHLYEAQLASSRLYYSYSVCLLRK